MRFRVAVLGATGMVGRTFLRLLEERSFPAADVVALASARSAGREVTFAGDMLRVIAATPDAFDGIDLVLSSAGGSVSRALLPAAAERGAVSVDNTSAFRMDPEVPLVVPEVNAHRIIEPLTRGIIANPNCSTIQLVVALKPLHDAFGLRRVLVSTYQSVSGAGQGAVDELVDSLRAYADDPGAHIGADERSIAFNAVPQIDTFAADAPGLGPFEGGAETREEWKMRVETSKIMEVEIPLHATCVRVPVAATHGESVWLETERPIDPDAAREVLRAAPGLEVLDDPTAGVYPTAVQAAGRDPVYVGRIRRDPTTPHGLALWIVADNIRKGAALNAVQIAERLVGHWAANGR
ncbi:MAG: aspartate-semialdehyde dehydrogenase [Acidobacteriota bacterium]